MGEWVGGRGGGGWGKVEINAISAQHSWNLAKLELGLSLAKVHNKLGLGCVKLRLIKLTDSKRTCCGYLLCSSFFLS